MLRDMQRVGIFLLLSFVSGLGGGFLIPFAAERGRRQTACVAGQEGAAAGSVLTVLPAAAVRVTIWQRSVTLQQLARTGSFTLAVGCGMAWTIGPGAAPIVVLVAIFFAVLWAPADEKQDPPDL